MAAVIIVDILLAAMLVTGFIIGLKRGFVKTILKPVRFFSCFGIAVGCASGFSKKVVSPIIFKPIVNKVSAYLYQHCPDITPATADEQLPTLLKIAAAVFGVEVNGLDAEKTQRFVDKIVETLAAPVVNVVATIISFFALFFLTKLIVTLVFFIIDKIFSKGVLGLPNKIFGCIFGTLFAFTVAWGFTIVFDFVIHAEMFSSVEWAYGFNGGFVFRLLRGLSPIELLLSF